MKGKVCLTSCMLLLLACGVISSSAEEAPTGDNAELRLQILKGFAYHETSRLLNLSQTLDRAYITLELEEAGLTKEKFPEIHQVLKKAVHPSLCQALYNQTKYGVIPFHEVIEATGEEGTEAADDQVFSATALSSVPNPHDLVLTTLTLGLYDEHGKHLPCSGHCKKVSMIQDYSHRPELEVNVAPRTSTSQKATALGMFFYVNRLGAPQPFPCVGVYKMTVKPNPPVELVKQTDPNDKNSDQQIKICLNRYPNVVGDCDEYHPNHDVTQMTFNVFGSAKYKKPIQVDKNGKPLQVLGNVWIARREGGGSCPAFAGKKSFKDFVKVIDADKTVASWKIERQDFGDGTVCIHQQDRLTYYLQLGLSIQGEEDPVWVYVTNRADATQTNYRYKIPSDMYFVWGCLKEGAQVTLPSGGQSPIESLKKGDLVVNHKGQKLSVTNIITGTEVKDLVCIEDDHGHSKLCVTEGHPVLTNGGPKLAKLLKAGDHIITDKGTAQVTKISHEKWTGKVYNLLLGVPPDQQGKHGMDETTVLANGIAVGDARMQQKYEMLDRHRNDTTLQRLPPEWTKDYQSWCALSGSCGKNPAGEPQRHLYGEGEGR